MPKHVFQKLSCVFSIYHVRRNNVLRCVFDDTLKLWTYIPLLFRWTTTRAKRLTLSFTPYRLYVFSFMTRYKWTWMWFIYVSGNLWGYQRLLSRLQRLWYRKNNVPDVQGVKSVSWYKVHFCSNCCNALWGREEQYHSIGSNANRWYMLFRYSVYV